MRVWRIARGVYDPLDGEGPRRFGGRWSSRGAPAVYTAAHLSLAVLEVLVHADPDLIPDDLAVFEVDVPDDLPLERVTATALPGDWQSMPEHRVCRPLGDGWLARGAASVLAVPSAIVPEETNYLINPAHPESSRVRVVQTRPFVFDPRLL
jgi:RES domain-containing protein